MPHTLGSGRQVKAGERLGAWRPRIVGGSQGATNPFRPTTSQSKGERDLSVAITLEVCHMPWWSYGHLPERHFLFGFNALRLGCHAVISVR
jgi:hypothetical protein